MMADRRPGSSTLSKYLKARSSSSRLIGPLDKFHQANPRDENRRTDVIHPSDLCKADFCARDSYFTILNGEPTTALPLRTRSIFDEGHAIHDKWQSWFRQAGWLYGTWRCLVCDSSWWDVSPEECVNPDCRSRLVRYTEVPVTDSGLMISGKADGWIIGQGDDCLIEVKSVGSGTIRMEQPALLQDDLGTAFRNIRRPFPTHMRQGVIYLELLSRMHQQGLLSSCPREVVFLYELKMDQSVKEFVVQADPELAKDMLDTAYDVARAVRSKTPPPCTHTIGGTCKRCSRWEIAA